MNEILQFIDKQLNIKFDFDFHKLSIQKQKQLIYDILNRPIRVCGMVENIGAPGGGPFLVKDENGIISPQIVELAQIDRNDPKNKELIETATHFNPVIMACWLKDYKGKKFNLTEFIDHDAIIITEKSKYGQTLKALELPGLWNGAMAKWNTVFVELPLQIFNPVKTVNDLLSTNHQMQE